MSGLLGDKSEQNNNNLKNGIMANAPIHNHGNIINADTVNVLPSVKKFNILEKNYQDLIQKVQTGENVDMYLSDINTYLHNYKNHSKRDVRNLEAKLLESDRESEIDGALLCKELATKFILENEQNKITQYLIANILHLIKTNFTKFITPLIKQGQSQFDVNIAIEKYIIEPIQEMISQTDFSPHFKQIENFLYYLAGNCHINWDQ